MDFHARAVSIDLAGRFSPFIQASVTRAGQSPQPTEKADADHDTPPACALFKRRIVMWHEHPEGPDVSVFKTLCLMAAAAFGLTFTGASVAAARAHDPSLGRPSDQGQYQIQISSDVLPIPIRRSHSWTLRLSDTSGRPVERASIEVAGRMPNHQRGLPRQVRVVPTDDPGVYKINGVRFTRTGWWVLNLAIQSLDLGADKVTFNVTL